MTATVVVGRIEDAVDGMLRLTAPGIQDNVYVLDIGTLANPPKPDHPVWRVAQHRTSGRAARATCATRWCR